MTGGIDLSIPGVIVLVANVVVGVSGGSNDKLAVALFVCLALSALVGLINGLLVGVAGLNSLIVTLAVGLIADGCHRRLRDEHRERVGSAAGVLLLGHAPARRGSAGSSGWASPSTIVLALVLRYTTVGRRFQAVGANPRAAWIAGISVRRYVVLAYVGAAVALRDRGDPPRGVHQESRASTSASRTCSGRSPRS